MPRVFPTQPYTVPINEREFSVAQEYHVPLLEFGHPYLLRIPKGYIFDGASVPRMFRSLTGITIDGIHRAAVLVHDYLYEHEGLVIAGDNTLTGSAFTYTRKEADEIFRRMLKHAGYSDHKIFIAYWGVRLGGWIYWR